VFFHDYFNKYKKGCEMQTISAYLYDNVIEVQIFDPSIFTTRNRVVYSRPIKVYQGIDNPIQVLMKNQDQKRVNITGYAVQADIQDPLGRVTVESLAVSWVDATNGVGTFIIPAEVINRLDHRFYKLTFKAIKASDNTERPLFMDDNYSVPLDLQVLPAYYSSTEPIPTLNNSILDGGTLEDDIFADGTNTETIIDEGTL
jgi:hypothetical protein